MKKSILNLAVAACFVLFAASCSSSCQTCTTAGVDVEICEDDYQAAATAAGLGDLTFDEYITQLETGGFTECN